MKHAQRNTLGWIAVTVVLFLVLLLVGMFLRAVQANQLDAAQGWFYPMMTLHGVGMAGLWWVGAMACASRVLARYVEPSEKVSSFAMLGTVAGVVLLLVSVFLGRFAAGWYFLYPLPLKGTWPRWSTVVFLASLTVLAVTWLVWVLDLLRAIAKKFPLTRALGWHYITGAEGPEVPPVVLITTVSLIAAIACLVSGAATVVFFVLELFTGTGSDPLLMKNLTFLFGHLLVNLSLYLAVGVIYDVLPTYTGRPWKANRVVAVAWNVVLWVVLFAYFHHLYMDFAQPPAFQYLGQVASYVSSIPSAVVTVFGAVALVYRAPVRWNLTVALFFLGLMGWGIGGIGAVIDSTIAVNSVLHNTLWVPAHFHTYMIEGLVLMVLGYFYHYCQEEAPIEEDLRLHKIATCLIVVGGYGFLAMFYLSGALGVPRRFAIYPANVAHGATLSKVALGFITLFLGGLLVYARELGRRWNKARQAIHA
ncbi:MAG: cbb3-type cytochrome c oxidase subunit I [Polyangiaceae bacterium]|nr:cbb3-type cytochrome c oxidase subunit I [Polyangiaceae bacterium]